MDAMRNILLGCLCLLLAGCASRTDPRDPYAPRELIPDPTFSGWFNLRGLGRPTDDGQVKGVFRTAAPVGQPVWTLAQWASRHSLADPAQTRQAQTGTALFAISNASKRVTVDCRTGEIALGLLASACYDRPRRQGESWPHLLAQAPLTDVRHPAQACRLDGMRRLDLSFSCRLDAFTDRHPQADPTLHAAQFVLFLYVQNLTPGDDGYGDMLWFGVPIFDNRYPVAPERGHRDGGKDDASGKFIYSMPGKAVLADGQGFVRDGRLPTGPDARWVEFRVDAAPWIAYAFKLARRRGFLATSDLSDLYVSGLNFGWEMPGTYDAAMRLRGLSLVATPHRPAAPSRRPAP